MPGLTQKNDQPNNANSSSYSLSCNNGVWSKHGDDISYNQLQKFWSELPSQARQDLLRIDKQTLFEHARKNMYCSRCNGLLLEVFMQIMMYGKSLQQEPGGVQHSFYKMAVPKDQMNNRSTENMACHDEVQDPSVHPWGGLTTTRDGALTLLDCYVCSASLKGLQNVFDSARARERERELLYPDACGGEGRGWISHGMVSFGRGHGTRETCALHTARLSCDTLVDFWSALSEETRFSLLRMKEDDFIERLMYRFDSKRFCRDCRRNVIREFKELKEIKRTRREPRCTTWFCVADTAFQYEVSNNTIHADWNQAFIDSAGKYHHFEWAVGTGEGKSDILNYENVGTKRSVKVNGLDLGGLNACYITLRAWKLDGRCTELSVKAHALKGEQCVHCSLMVGDGYVAISHGESIRRFFEHAEEAEEEEDDSSVDKDGNELDDECSRPQKHAKSPELAREFLLDAASVIFKEQVEKAFREGTARQNAHSIFVCLALKLLEERALVACKEIVTLEKQIKLLEEEEIEKREEEERKERKRTKEREKKLRRKERLRGKDKVNKCSESNQASDHPDFSNQVSLPCVTQEPDDSMEELVSESADPTGISPPYPDIHDVNGENDYISSELQSNCPEDENTFEEEDENNFLTVDDSRLSDKKLELDLSRGQCDRHQSTESGSMIYQSESRYCNDNPQFSVRDGNGYCNRQSRSSAAKFSFRNSGPRFNHKLQCTSNRVTVRNDCGRPRSRIPNHGNSFSREVLHTKKVWEPVTPQKRYPRCCSDSDVTLMSSSFKVSDKSGADDSVDSKLKKSSCKVNHNKHEPFPVEATAMCNVDEEDDSCLTRSCKSIGSPDFSASSSSSSDNCSSYLSEGDSNTVSSTSPIQESSSTTDSEDGSQLSEERETSVCTPIGFSEDYCQVPLEIVLNKDKNAAASETADSGFVTSSQGSMNGIAAAPSVGPFQQGLIPQMFNVQNIHYPTFQTPPMMGYYHQNQQVSWPNPLANGFGPYAHPNPYLLTSHFSYTLSGDPSYCMPYGAAMQHLPSPLFNAPPQVPVYQPFHLQEQRCFPTKLTGVMEPNNQIQREKVVHTGPSPKQEPTSFCEKKISQVETDNTGFSLFKFAGPVATALSATKPEIESLDEGFSEDLSSDLSTDDQACSKKDTNIEEYKLFAASKGIGFSFF